MSPQANDDDQASDGSAMAQSAQDRPERPMGFFERIALRMTGSFKELPKQGMAKPVRVKAEALDSMARDRDAINTKGSSVGLSKDVGSMDTAQKRAWDRLAALLGQIVAEDHSEQGAEDLRLKKINALWAPIVEQEIKEFKASMVLAKKAGWAPAESMIMSMDQPQEPWGPMHQTTQDSAKVFALGWEEDERWAYRASQDEEQEAKPYRWRESGLEDYGVGGPEKLASLALTLRCLRRTCDMASGRFPRFTQTDSSSEFSETLGFSSEYGVWGHVEKVDARALSGGRSFGSVAAGIRHEPSLGLISQVAGALAIEALRHGNPSEADKLIDGFARHWEDGSGYGRRVEGLGRWRMPNPAHLQSYKLLYEPDGVARAKVLNKIEQAARAAGVPAWSMGVGEVPAERWMAEPLASRIEHAPKFYWGEAEDQRAQWTQWSKKERKDLSAESLSASYSDDPSCRRSEQEDCSRRSNVVNAQEALLDWAMRVNLSADSPWALTPACAANAVKALRAIGQDTVMDLPYKECEEAIKQAGLTRKDFANPSLTAKALEAWAQAREIASVTCAGSKPRETLRM